MSKPTPPTPQTNMTVTMGGKGGPGKSLTLSFALADYLQRHKVPFFAVECDTENDGKPTAFSHWFDHPVRINLRNPDDCDRLLDEASRCGVPYVLVDLPANAAGDFGPWWKEVVTPRTLKKLGIKVTGLGVTTPEMGSSASVVEWIALLGNNIDYLVAFNRRLFAKVELPLEEVFTDWKHVKVDPSIRLRTFEVPFLAKTAMDELLTRRKLPSAALDLEGDEELTTYTWERVKRFRDKVHSQLDALNLIP
jgi:hypothetical protein